MHSTACVWTQERSDMTTAIAVAIIVVLVFRMSSLAMLL